MFDILMSICLFLLTGKPGVDFYYYKVERGEYEADSIDHIN